jgi:hypothetical protein
VVLGVPAGRDLFRLFGVSVPTGFSLLTPAWVWHNDCFLCGPYEVAYTKGVAAETVSLAALGPDLQR